jgi:DUF4097 and DUF4098 domain-containing protein YvlB
MWRSVLRGCGVGRVLASSAALGGIASSSLDLGGNNAPGSSWLAGKRTMADIRGLVTLSALDVETDGDITFRDDCGLNDDNVHISALVRGATIRRARDTVLSATRRWSDNTLVVRVMWPDGGKQPTESADVEIAFGSKFKRVHLKGDHGRVYCRQQHGTCDVQTTSGPVYVDGHFGDVHVQTGSGPVHLFSIQGSASAVTDSGHVTVFGVDGAFEGHSTSGDIEAKFVHGRCMLETVSGNVFAAVMVLGKPVDAASCTGSVEACHISGPVKLRATTGTVTARHVDGGLTAETTTGPITAGYVTGLFAAKSDGGDVAVHMLNGSAAVETRGAGTVTVELCSSGPVDITTQDGNVNLSIGRQFEGALHTVSAHDGTRTILESSTGPVSAVRTDTGTIHVAGSQVA